MSNSHPVKLEFFMVISRLQLLAVCTLNFFWFSLLIDFTELLSRYLEYIDCVLDLFIGVFMRIEQGTELYKDGHTIGEVTKTVNVHPLLIKDCTGAVRCFAYGRRCFYTSVPHS